MFSETFKKIGIIIVAIALGTGTAAAALGGCSNTTKPTEQHQTP